MAVNVSPLYTPISFFPRPPHCLPSLSFELSAISFSFVCLSLCVSLLLALSVERRNVCSAVPPLVRCGASADRFGV